MNTADICVLAILALFAVWGALRGAARQLATVLVIGVGVFAATQYGSILVSTVSKVVGVDGDASNAAAWMTMLIAVLVLGAVLFSFLSGWFEKRNTEGALRRSFGAALGLLTGIGVLFVLGYGVLGYRHGPGDGPVLQRSAGAERTDGGATEEAADEMRSGEPAWVVSTRSSAAASVLSEGGGVLRRWLEVPAWMQSWMERVERVESDVRDRGP